MLLGYTPAGVFPRVIKAQAKAQKGKGKKYENINNQRTDI